MKSGATDKRLGRILVQAGLITDEQLEMVLESDPERALTEALVQESIASEEQIAQAIARQLGLAYVDLGTYEIDPNATVVLSTDFARRYQVIPIAFQDDELVVAMADPANIVAVDDVCLSTGHAVRPVVATESDLSAAIEKYCAAQQDVDAMVDDLESFATTGEVIEKEEEDTDDSAPVAKLMNLVITQAIRENAGDIYIEPQETDMRIRYRVDGVCHEALRSPKRLHRQLISRIKIASGMDIAESRVAQDGRFSVMVDRETVDFRVAMLPGVEGEVCAMRLLRKEAMMRSLEELGLLNDPLNKLISVLAKPYGCMLVTGPAGSGKSTTLYAAINQTKDPTKNLITVEDPVEYRLDGLSQVQVNEKAGLTFAAALRSILRQDPDIVMIGEIRDRETGMIATEAALTGHLVLSTLHTNDAPSAITRLTEMGIEPFLTASAVNGVMAQRLARCLCPDCKEQYEPPPESLERAGMIYDPDNPPTLYRARGCKRCGNIGYRGRLGVMEVFVMSEAIEKLVVENASGDVLKAQAIAEGMIPLKQDGFEKVKMGLTSIEEILRIAA